MLNITVAISQNSSSDRKMIDAIIKMLILVHCPYESYPKQLTHPFLPSLTHRPVWNVIALIISVIYLLEYVYKISRLFITIHWHLDAEVFFAGENFLLPNTHLQNVSRCDNDIIENIFFQVNGWSSE